MTRNAEQLQETPGIYQYGVPTSPVVALAKMDVMGPNTAKYEGRIGVNSGGINIVSELLPVERAVYGAMRPHETFVELGKYEDGDYNIANRLINTGAVVFVNGQPQIRDSQGAIPLVRKLVGQRGISRMVTHEVNSAMPQIARELGVDLPEKPDVYTTLSSKTGLNQAITEYAQTRPESKLRPFGENCNNLDSVIEEVVRLKESGVGAYLKLDSVRGIVAAGGLGHLGIPLDMEIGEVRERILELTGGESHFDAVTQMLLSDYQVLSLSSGQSLDGTYKVYEAHEQTVDGSSADGARPILKGGKLEKLLEGLWKDVSKLYEYNGLTGDQNLNAMVLSHSDYLKACEVYGADNSSQIYLSDLNYRAITGTRNAMTRYQGDTGHTLDLHRDYRYRGIKVAPVYATNPHIMIAAGKLCGLAMGKGGNSTIVNMGTFTPDAIAHHHGNGGSLKTQVIVQLPRAAVAIDEYETLLGDEGLARRLASSSGLPFIDPNSIEHMQSGEYQRVVSRGMRAALDYDRNHERRNGEIVHGNVWAWQ